MQTAGGGAAATTEAAAVRYNILGKTLVLRRQPQNHESTGNIVWEAGTVLGRFLHKQQKKLNVRGKKCLELGAGCGGVPGMVLALLGAELVFWTDVECVLPLLRRNVEANVSLLREVGGEGQPRQRLVVQEYAFGEDTAPLLRAMRGKEEGKEEENDETEEARTDVFDIIVGSDIVFKSELVDPLVKSLAELSDPRTQIFIALEVRCETTQQFFLEQVQKQFLCKRVRTLFFLPLYSFFVLSSAFYHLS
ncbi:Protein-lysine methyltransferase METTL21B [Balamuthia mandrillaris]